MNKTKIVAAAVTLIAAATVGPLSTPAQATPSPTSISPCTKTIATSWVGRGWATVYEAGTNGTRHTVEAGHSQRFCPGGLYVSSGYDGQAWTGSQDGFTNGTTWTSTGNHNFTSKQKDPNTGTLWVKIW